MAQDSLKRPSDIAVALMMDHLRNNNVRSLENADPIETLNRRKISHVAMMQFYKFDTEALQSRAVTPATPLQSGTQPTPVSGAFEENLGPLQTGGKLPDMEGRARVMDARNNFTRNFGHGPSITLEEVIPWDDGLPGVQVYIANVKSSVAKMAPADDKGVLDAGGRLDDLPLEFSSQYSGMELGEGSGWSENGYGAAPNLPPGSTVYPVKTDWSTVTSGFGPRYHPVLHTRRMHTGIDISAHHNGTSGPPILAWTDGTVVFAGSGRPFTGYGNCIIIDHGRGIFALYGHNYQNIAGLGSQVKAGEVIAVMGKTGLSSGVHLHFEIRVGGMMAAAVNPNSYLANSRKIK